MIVNTELHDYTRWGPLPLKSTGCEAQAQLTDSRLVTLSVCTARFDLSLLQIKDDDARLNRIPNIIPASSDVHQIVSVTLAMPGKADFAHRQGDLPDSLKGGAGRNEIISVALRRPKIG